MSTAPFLDDQLRRCQRHGARVIAHLEGVEFIDVAGLRVLMSASERSGPGGFSVTPGPPQLQRLLELTGMDAAIDVIEPACGVHRAAA